MEKSVLVVAAHPDDEILGCGGIIAKHSEKNDDVHVLIAAEGHSARSRHERNSEDLDIINHLKVCAKKANRLLGAKSIDFLDLADNRLDSLDRLDLIQKLESVVIRHNPDIVYVHHLGDLNIDHRRLHEAVLTACRPIPGQSVRQILSYEIMSSTEWQTPNCGLYFIPNWYEDISDQWLKKKEALKVYASEMREWPHSRSIKSLEILAKHRGSQVGLQKAEAFMLIRQIVQ